MCTGQRNKIMFSELFREKTVCVLGGSSRECIYSCMRVCGHLLCLTEKAEGHTNKKSFFFFFKTTLIFRSRYRCSYYLTLQISVKMINHNKKQMSHVKQ